MPTWTMEKTGAVVDGPAVDTYADDVLFYRDGPGADDVAAVSLDGRTVTVYCVGEMRVLETETESLFRHAGALLEHGYRTDEGIANAEARGDIEIQNNPWFEIVVTGSGEAHEEKFVDLIAHSYSEALLMAEDVLVNPFYSWAFDTADAG